MSKLFTDLRRELKKAADPARAPDMQRYMKSSMPYYGVRAPLVREICQRLFRELKFRTFDEWAAQIREIWNGALAREEKYAAVILCQHKVSVPFHSLKALPLYEELIVTGAWWDFVDTLAAHSVGELLRKYPIPMKRKMLSWSKSKNLWKRRTAILSQLSFGKDTDLKLLYACIEPSIESEEFFLRKAIGWALRQYAWFNPREVKRYVKSKEKRLSGLSRREALKNCSGKKVKSPNRGAPSAKRARRSSS